MKRYAGIDIGSNAVRLLIADIVRKEGLITYKKVTLVRVPLRLGDDAFLHQELSEPKANDLLKTIHAFKNLMDVYGVDDFMACATSAMRESQNGQKVLDEILKQTSVSIEVVSGHKEANIIYSGLFANISNINCNYLCVDVGGGSTELSLFSSGNLIASKSFDLGTIRILDNKDRKETWADLQSWIKCNIKNLGPIYGIGSGGNINKLFRLSGVKEGLPLSYRKLHNLYSHLKTFTYSERISVLGLSSDRADVIIPASEIYLTVMNHAGIKQMYVPRVGLADGIINTLIQKNKKELSSVD